MIGPSDYASQRRTLVGNLKGEGSIKTEQVAKAFLNVPREEFVPQESKAQAYVDSPLSLGETGQTISAPHMSAIILEELDLEPGLSVLEVGTGSGYNAALIAEIVSPTTGRKTVGKVLSVEIIPELAELARANLHRSGYSGRVEVVVGDGSLGYPEGSSDPIYDRVVVTAAAPEIPPRLEAQTKEKGMVLVPVGDRWIQNLVNGLKRDGELHKRAVCECVFVPLVGEKGHKQAFQ